MPVVDFISCVFVQFGYCHHSCHAVIVCHHSHHHHRVGIFHFLSHNSYFILYVDENFFIRLKKKKIYIWLKKRKKMFQIFQKVLLLVKLFDDDDCVNTKSINSFFLGFLDSDSLDDNLIIIDFHIFFSFSYHHHHWCDCVVMALLILILFSPTYFLFRSIWSVTLVIFGSLFFVEKWWIQCWQWWWWLLLFDIYKMRMKKE